MSSSFQNETFPCCIKTSWAFAPTNVPKKDNIIKIILLYVEKLVCQSLF